MIDVVVICGSEFKAPTEAKLSGYLLNDMVEDMRVELEENRKEWIEKGCTIMTDGGQIGGIEHSSIFLYPVKVIDHSTFLHT